MANEWRRAVRKLWKRNQRILNTSSRKVVPYRVNLHWWSMNRADHVENIGDYLSKVICDYMLAQKGLDFDKPVTHTRHLYSVGSIIQGGAQDATIWGSGLKKPLQGFDTTMRWYRKLDIRLVRGPKTREALLKSGFSCPQAYGDPAIILPMIYQPGQEKCFDYTVVLHKDTNQQIENSIMPLGCDYKPFVDRLSSSRLVISSSLHGIILAETYGVPALLLSDTETENLFKYQDYYQSTGRPEFPIASSLEEALQMEPLPVPDFTHIRNTIISTFPYDLWED